VVWPGASPPLNSSGLAGRLALLGEGRPLVPACDDAALLCGVDPAGH
jgi:hypothetical protein